MVLPQKKNRGSRFDQQQNLRRLLHSSEASKRLLYPIIKNVKIFAAQPFHKVPPRIGDDHSNVHAVNAYTNRRPLLL